MAPEFVKERRAAPFRDVEDVLRVWRPGRRWGDIRRSYLCVSDATSSVHRRLFVLSSVKVAASSRSVPNKCCIVHDLHN